MFNQQKAKKNEYLPLERNTINWDFCALSTLFTVLPLHLLLRVGSSEIAPYHISIPINPITN